MLYLNLRIKLYETLHQDQKNNDNMEEINERIRTWFDPSK